MAKPKKCPTRNKTKQQTDKVKTKMRKIAKLRKVVKQQPNNEIAQIALWQAEYDLKRNKL